MRFVLLRMNESKGMNTSFLPLPQGWARRDVGNSSEYLTKFSKRPKIENVDFSSGTIERKSNQILMNQLDTDILGVTKLQECARPFKRRRRLDDAVDAIRRHADNGEKRAYEGGFSQSERPYRPWRSTRSFPNAVSSADLTHKSRTDLVQYRDEFADPNAKSIYREEGDCSHACNTFPSLFGCKWWQHAPFPSFEPTKDFKCDIRTHPACCLPTCSSENWMKLSSSSSIPADSYDSNLLDRKHFLFQSQNINGKENNCFCEENIDVPRNRSCRSQLENNFFRMQTITPPDFDYYNCARPRHFPGAPQSFNDAEFLRATSSQPKPMFSRALPPNYLHSDDQDHENRLGNSSQLARLFTGCHSMNHTIDNSQKLNLREVHGSSLVSHYEQERDCQSDRPESTDSLLEVFTEEWVSPFAPKHSTPKGKPLQPEGSYTKEQSTPNSTLSTSNYQLTKELEKECWQDIPPVCSRKMPIPRFYNNNNNDKAIQVSFKKHTRNVEVQVLLSTAACPRCGYASASKGASEVTLCSQMPTTKLNSSLKTPRTVQSLEQITNLNNDTTSSTNTFVSVDLPLPVNLPNERTPRQCIVQEGGATDSVYNVYSTARSILPHYSMPNQHAASTKMKEQVKLADISSSPYEFGVED